jgi:hypothetical protein
VWLFLEITFDERHTSEAGETLRLELVGVVPRAVPDVPDVAAAPIYIVHM